MQVLAPESYQRSHGLTNATPSLRWVAMGDSTVYGFGDPEGGGWVERLRRRWMLPNSPAHALYNLGVRGDGVQNVARRLDAEFHCRGELRNQVPDLILLSVGINDSARLGKAHGRHFTDLGVFRHEIAQLLDHARALCPVLFVGMTPVDSSRMPFAGCLYYGHTDQRLFKEATQIACEKHNVPYLDIFDTWLSRGELWWRSHLSADGLHPNSLGYKALLQDFLQWEDAQCWIDG